MKERFSRQQLGGLSIVVAAAMVGGDACGRSIPVLDGGATVDGGVAPRRKPNRRRPGFDKPL